MNSYLQVRCVFYQPTVEQNELRLINGLKTLSVMVTPAARPKGNCDIMTLTPKGTHRDSHRLLVWVLGH